MSEFNPDKLPIPQPEGEEAVEPKLEKAKELVLAMLDGYFDYGESDSQEYAMKETDTLKDQAASITTFEDLKQVVNSFAKKRDELGLYVTGSRRVSKDRQLDNYESCLSSLHVVVNQPSDSGRSFKNAPVEAFDNWLKDLTETRATIIQWQQEEQGG